MRECIVGKDTVSDREGCKEKRLMDNPIAWDQDEDKEEEK